jgi:hypothetical protein
MLHIVNHNQNILILKDNNIIAHLVGIIFLVVGFTIIIKPSVFTNNPPIIFGIISLVLGLFVILVAKVTTVTIK